MKNKMAMHKTITTHSLAETHEFAKLFLAELKKAGLGQSATVVALNGDLGAGKTALTSGLLAALGVERPATSPTFVIMKHYSLPEAALPFKHLYHIDAYRISGEDLDAISFHEIKNDPTALVVIEWANRLEEYLPTGTIRLQCEHGTSETERHFSYN
jgi:tRNA threonylcarbamoyladenosine biosynthesis protein TsaE